jgi:hypothetical protein
MYNLSAIAALDQRVSPVPSPAINPRLSVVEHRVRHGDSLDLFRPGLPWAFERPRSSLGLGDKGPEGQQTGNDAISPGVARLPARAPRYALGSRAPRPPAPAKFFRCSLPAPGVRKSWPVGA